MLRVELRALAPAPGTIKAPAPPGAGRRSQLLTDRSASLCLFSCRQPRGDARSAAGAYALAPGAAGCRAALRTWSAAADSARVKVEGV